MRLAMKPYLLPVTVGENVLLLGDPLFGAIGRSNRRRACGSCGELDPVAALMADISQEAIPTVIMLEHNFVGRGMYLTQSMECNNKARKDFGCPAD